VTVADVTAEYCAVGETLTGWTHRTDRVSFVHASALDRPFDDASFDVVWTQHASMNILGQRRPISRGCPRCPIGRAVRVLRHPCRSEPADPLSSALGG